MNYYTIERIVRKVNKELVPEFEEKLRLHLEKQDKDWLIEQIIRLTLDKHSLQEWDRKVFQQLKEKQRAERLARLKEMQFDEPNLDAFITQYAEYDRARLESEDYLYNPPPKGTDIITPEYRSERGEILLTLAKDTLFAILFGDESMCVYFDRVEQELLTMTLPRYKAQALDFMKATTEIGGLGTWQDPNNASNEDHAEYAILQVEYGEVDSKRIRDGIITTLSLVNNLEVNEQVLYARVMHVEQSSLIT